MGKIKCLLVILLGVLTITSCGNSSSVDDSTSSFDQQPLIFRRIEFNGEFVNAYRYSSPIAFDSYHLKDNYLIIDGRAYCSPYDKYTIDFLEYEFNYLDAIHLQPNYSFYDPVPEWLYDVEEPSIRWEIKELPGDLIFTFSIHIDLSSFLEYNVPIGLLSIWYNFYVFHDFSGESIC